MLRKEKGITLIALVITILILIILAVVAINLAFGDNGLIKRAEDAGDYYANGVQQEGEYLSSLDEYIDSVINQMKFKEVSAGNNHSLGIDEEGNLWAWGSNNSGQLGDGTTEDKTSPVQIKAGTKFKAISAGVGYSLGIDEEGNLWAWGSNFNGQLGDGTTEDRTTPVQIKAGTKFKAISAGRSHSLAIDESGNLWVWGNNDYGQLGDGTTETRTNPVQIKAGTKFNTVCIDLSWQSSSAIDEEGNLWTWGRNEYGHLGLGTTEDKTSPVQASPGIKFKDVDLNAYAGEGWAIDVDNNLWTTGTSDLYDSVILELELMK